MGCAFRAGMTDTLQARSFKGAERELRRLAGARAVRVSHGYGQAIGEHRHDWPTLTVHLLGSCEERYERGIARLNGPSAIFHPAGAVHSDDVAEDGLETFGLVFDPAWLRHAGFDPRRTPTLCCSGGKVAAAARALASMWAVSTASERELGIVTSRFFAVASQERQPRQPKWLPQVRELMETRVRLRTTTIAAELGLHPASLARAYRAATGEGLDDAVRRRRLAYALRLLRTSELPLADIAARSGFCDQAHMNRCFRAVLDCTPTSIRR